jgi:two-component system nitrate/nitrite response regulator NarL
MFLIVCGDDDFDATAEQVEVFKTRFSDARIAVVADHYRLSELVAAFRAGATGYFVDAMSCDAFIKSIELVMMGEAVFPSEFLLVALGANAASAEKANSVSDRDTTIEVPADPLVQLSPRERSILRCLIEGASNKCIARKIDISEATVKVHIKAILRKIRVQNRTQAAIWGIHNQSLARPMGKGPPQLSSAANKRSAREIPDLRRIERAIDGPEWLPLDRA